MAGLHIDEIGVDGGLQLIITGAPIPGDGEHIRPYSSERIDNVADEEITTSEIAAAPPADTPDDPTVTTIKIVVPTGYTLGPIWEKIDPAARATALAWAGALLEIGKGATTGADESNIDLRLKLIQTQQAFEEYKAKHADEAIEERKKNESEMSFLKKDVGQAISRIEAVVSTAFGKGGTPKDKGEIGEAIVEKWISQWFPSCSIAKCGEGHAMDFLVIIPPPIGADSSIQPFRVLLEVKNKQKVQTTDVDQFERDITENRANADAAIFISLRCTRIPGRGEIYLGSQGRVVYAYMGGTIDQQSRDVKLMVETLRQFSIRYAKFSDWDSQRASLVSGLARSLKVLRNAEERARKAVKASIQLQQDVAFLASSVSSSIGMLSVLSSQVPGAATSETKSATRKTPVVPEKEPDDSADVPPAPVCPQYNLTDADVYEMFE